MTIKYSILYQTHDFGSGQIQPLDNFLVRRDLQKLRHGGLPAGTPPAGGSAKVPGLVSAVGATNVYSLNRRAVRLSKNLPFLFITMRLVILQKIAGFVP